jgi:pimeloyl-ACP methyl ester carboxylesterase
MKPAALALLAVLAASCAPMSIDESNVFQPRASVPPNRAPATLTLDGENTLGPETKLDNRLSQEQVAYTVATRALAGATTRPLVVHCGGNASNRQRDGVFYIHKAISRADVLIFDYPGYGDSPGEPTAQSMERTAASVIQIAQSVAAGRPIVFWGHSLGGFVCAQMASRTPGAAGMIFEASAPNVREVARAWTPGILRPFVRPRIAESLLTYDNALAMDGFRGPILIFGALNDDTLPVELSRSLNAQLQARGLNATYVESTSAGHASLPQSPEFTPALKAFFAQITPQT